ncbi:MAG: hypothetical protein ACP5SG_00595 [Dissulfurimicrobium sp.]|uniref:hypothetical protein n=1 Tax=Dissulfurimicrobium sp. TaxID=2022436 RepID=UPI003D0E07E8
MSRYPEIIGWFCSHTPRSSALTNLFLAGLMWSLVGTFLLLRGGLNMNGFVGRPVYPVFLAAWAAVGLLKGRLILDRAAVKVLERIVERGDGRCMGGFLGARSWGLILAMIMLGRILRLSPLPPSFVWGVYTAIGTGLLFSSRTFWARWIGEIKARHPVA